MATKFVELLKRFLPLPDYENERIYRKLRLTPTFAGLPLADALKQMQDADKRRLDWDCYYFGFATHAATKSKDQTKVGAILVGLDGEVRLSAFNGPPKGVRDLPERFERPLKYKFAAHAERNLIAFAAREAIRTKDCTVYCTHAPCSICAQTMIQAGIKHLVFGPGVFQGMDDEVAASREMFRDVGGTLRHFSCSESFPNQAIMSK